MKKRVARLLAGLRTSTGNGYFQLTSDKMQYEEHSSQIATELVSYYRHIATGFVCSKILLSYLNNTFSRNETN